MKPCPWDLSLESQAKQEIPDTSLVDTHNISFLLLPYCLELLDEPRPNPATPAVSCSTADRQHDTSTQPMKKKCNIDPKCRQFVSLILKLNGILSRDPESEALVLGRMKLSLATLKGSGQDESTAIDPEVYRGADTPLDFFRVMSKYWNCYADHDLLTLVIDATENKEAIDAVHCFLRSRDPEMAIPVTKCPEVPFKSACSDSGTETLKRGIVKEESPQKLEDRHALTLEENQQDPINSTITADTSQQPPADTSQQPHTSLQPPADTFQQPHTSLQPPADTTQQPPDLQCLHHHPGCDHKLPPKRMPLIVEVGFDSITYGSYNYLKDVVASVLKIPKEAMSLQGVYKGMKGSYIVVWHVSEGIAAEIERIRLSSDNQEMLLQCMVMKMSCGDVCLLNASKEELVSVCVCMCVCVYRES